MSNNLRQYSLNADNSFTDWYPTGSGSAPLFIITSGTWEGIVTCQIRYPGRTEPLDMPGERFETNFDIPANTLPIEA